MLIMSICFHNLNMSKYIEPLWSYITGVDVKGLTSTGRNEDSKEDNRVGLFSATTP